MACWPSCIERDSRTPLAATSTAHRRCLGATHACTARTARRGRLMCTVVACCRLQHRQTLLPTIQLLQEAVQARVGSQPGQVVSLTQPHALRGDGITHGNDGATIPRGHQTQLACRIAMQYPTPFLQGRRAPRRCAAPPAACSRHGLPIVGVQLTQTVTTTFNHRPLHLHHWRRHAQQVHNAFTVADACEAVAR